MLLQIAKCPAYPPYAIVVGPDEVWDCDTSSSTIEKTLELARELYPNDEVILFDDPRHYSQRGE